jgi:hypothetical protein
MAIDSPNSTKPKINARRGVTPGAAHLVVDVAVVPHVDGVGRTRHQVAANHRPYNQIPRRRAARRDEHASQRGEQQQRNHARLGQRDIGADGLPDGDGRGSRFGRRERGSRHHRA